MRQAGRYLPEYREVRAKSDGFLDMCYSPQKAVEVTLQPIRRFGMDAAIIFSDILVVPHAMGMEVGFVTGEGPKLVPLSSKTDAESLKTDTGSFLSPVYEAIAKTRAELSPSTSLIGFSGAPWTLACYMFEGGGGGEFSKARQAIYAQPELFFGVMDRLVRAVSDHLILQVKAGADALQIFDSWSGLAPAGLHENLIYEPTRRIIREVKNTYPEIPVIGFPRGMGGSLGEYVNKTGVDGVGVDSFTSLFQARQDIPPQCVIQGNLDPLLLATDKEKTLRQAREILTLMEGRKFIFNLGHGIVPHTPVEHVAALSEMLRAESERACA